MATIITLKWVRTGNFFLNEGCRSPNRHSYWNSLEVYLINDPVEL